MVGNCAHCHNPHGLPSVTKPELATLNFLPDGHDGGVFEMSFEKMSPIRARGSAGDIPIPYITPSLRDYPVATEPDLIRLDNGLPVAPAGDNAEITWTPKHVPSHTCDENTRETRAYCGTRKTGLTFVPAPWRSLIYRNVDSPFAYFDDYVPFPHMPMNTFGFDCRAPRIMGVWMVGLPAKRKREISEDVLPKRMPTMPTWVDEFGGRHTDMRDNEIGDYDKSPQPYIEVKPDDDGYADAVKKAEARLGEYHAGVRYNYCEDVLSPDIYDPVISEITPRGYRPAPDRFLLGANPPLDPNRPGEFIQPAIGVPYHSHFFPYDPTDTPPPWSPRRPDWATEHLIVPPLQDDPSLPAGRPTLDEDVIHDRQVVAAAINEASFTDEIKAYATTEIPYGLWEVKQGCTGQLATQPKVSDFSANRPAWMDRVKPAADAPVYMAAPGATLYRHICINCHGPRADGKGLQADALAASSEGEARPANFREGLFGPSDNPGANLRATFAIGTGGVDAVGWASRYMAWMALGGTLKRIPQDIIHQVEATKVLGQQRLNLELVPGSGEA